MMTDEPYEMLKNMHGIVRIELDQRDLKLPFFLKKMQYKSFETLAPVMEGGEHETPATVIDQGVERVRRLRCKSRRKMAQVSLSGPLAV